MSDDRHKDARWHEVGIMTDIVEQLRDPSVCVKREEVADEFEKLCREVRTLRNFLVGIKASADLALRDYGQPTGAETNAMREEAIDLLGRAAEGDTEGNWLQEVHGWLEKYVPGWTNIVEIKP